ncbi:succinate dehydrogenase/fumarate reductase iron-sulfur subunit [Hartmannibacter diazotrophicus]|uniref:Succinate dehydrogenase/fumarate reductase iron-sulfur subunit n=1 Tax=Hartmannibacter diazotrophicus TaxID=1482074 RepID=A0A2C9D026_9HYPH|nr:DUF3483 domain-containing protein [Hartmannibacter diazotrophicus]SON53610.1 succinate dehydrogenase/fumarate reductase iron-sulfur subunit [Hartmannibacter diazotrophicus]
MTLLFPLLILALALAAVAVALKRARLWRIGKPAAVDWFDGLKALPRRYLHDVHDVVARDPFTARMHALVAGGLLAGSGLALLGLLPVLGHARPYWWLVALTFGVMLAGSVMVGRRRIPTRPKNLSAGRFQTLPFLLVGYGIGGFLAAIGNAAGSPVLAGAGLVLAAIGGAGLVVFLDNGPLRHALAGALHLAAHPRSGRFEGRRETALRPLDLEKDEKLGTETPADFTWNRLLGFDACIQCGRCELACPAFASGQPLNPKRLIQDLVSSLVPDAPAYAGSPYPNARDVAGSGGPHAAIIGEGAMIHPDTLWSCTTCRACVEECPMMIEHVDAIVDLRRFQTMELGRPPEKAAQPLLDMRQAEEPGGRALASRTDFAAGRPLRVLKEGERADVLLWLGEGAFELRYGRTLRALVTLLDAAGVDYAVLGPEERDCGDLARRLGDEATFQMLAKANIATLRARSFNRILTADPHALHVIRNEYPQFGGAFEVGHHSAFLADLAASGRIELGSLSGAVTYHDPCYLGRYNGEIEAPRALLDALGLNRAEMVRSGKRSMCCGGGGGAPVADIPGDTRIPDLRMGQARETGAPIVAVACPMCTAMLEGVTGDRPEVKDIAELMLMAHEAAGTAPLREAAE